MLLLFRKWQILLLYLFFFFFFANCIFFANYIHLVYLRSKSIQHSFTLLPSKVKVLVLNHMWCTSDLIAASGLHWDLSFCFLLMTFPMEIRRIYPHSLQIFYRNCLVGSLVFWYVSWVLWVLRWLSSVIYGWLRKGFVRSSNVALPDLNIAKKCLYGVRYRLYMSRTFYRCQEMF